MAQVQEKIPNRIKFIYSLGEFGPSVAVGTIIPFYFLFFLTDVAHIKPGVAGTLLLVARLWDAINDPLVGNISDRTHSKWGRRRPYFLSAAVPMGILFALLWVVPEWNETMRAIYYFVLYLIFDTAFTFVQGPYTALTPEMTLDPDERTSLITWRMSVSIITGLIAAVAMDIILSAFPDIQTGFAVMGLIVGIISILPYFWIFFAIKEKPEYQQDVSFNFFEGLKNVFQNKSFRLAFIAETFAWTTISMVEGVFTFFLIYWVGVPKEDSPLIMAIILASAALFLPLVSQLSKWFEKKWAFIISTGVWALVHIALWFIPQHQIAPIYIAAALAGLGVSAAHVLPGAMTADTLEVGELQSGARQEGVYIGIAAFGRKLGVSLSLFVLGWVLDLTGYIPNALTQSAEALQGIRVLVSWVPLGLLIISIIAASAFPITRERHLELREQLAAKGKEKLPEG